MKLRRLCAWIGIAAQLLFTAYWLIATAWQGPHYSVLADSISDMYAVTAPFGDFMVIVVTVCGVATIVFVALSLLPTLAPQGWTALVGSLLLWLSIFGIGDLLTPFEREGCRIADEGCTAAKQLGAGGAADAFLSTIGALFLIAAGVFLFVALRKASAPRALTTAVLILAIATFVMFVLLGVNIPGLGGLLERLLAIFGAGMIAVLGIATLSLIARSAPEPSSPPPGMQRR